MFTVPLIGAAASLFSSLVASFAGGGSSLILLPLLLWLTGGAYASVLTITKVAATIMTLVATRIHFKKGQFHPLLFLTITATAIIGTGVGTYLVQYRFNEQYFKTILAIFLLVTALYLLVSKKRGLKHGKERPISLVTLLAVSAFCIPLNILNGMFGGTGIILTIFLVIYMRMTFIQAIAYTMGTYLIVNILQTSYLLFTEPVEPVLTILVLFGSLIGSRIGTNLQYLKGNIWVKRIAILLMCAISLKLLIS